eukprot:CAMPEP_0168748338 /NCGR_PEP_ID=MMETSP0724-20121128/16123_1 /TAXON_ID=265536 /ORGANISM="Amphiprora sp., Strain CCMP467" /LENGTH=229 /DNA_ID=CAMNT_0008796161 /DNA_START=29 /DNA_END=718 /DNA_ORIENTATION=-
MPSLWDKAKLLTKRTKLQGELVMLEREMKNRKALFGVELYDLLVADPKSFGGSIVPGMGASQNATVAQLKVEQLSKPFEQCKQDIADIESVQQSNKTEQDHLAESRENYADPRSAGETFSKAGNWISTNAQELTLSAKTKLLDRDITKRKEMFGLLAYESYVASGVFDQTSNGGRTPKEKKIHECLERSKNVIAMLERQQGLTEREIEDINESLGQSKQEAAAAATEST